jgi:hypothetical protein
MTQIKRIYDGTVLFSHDSVSVKETLLAAIAAGADLRSVDLRDANLQYANLQGANLQGANLRGANLRGANLRDANLRGANLWGADLRGADLEGANLRDANLRDANLRDANLRDANLQGANLQGANLQGANLRRANLPADYRIARIDFGGWSVTITPTETSIGCQMHPNELWLKADPRWIDTMDMRATAWWARHGATIQAAIRDVQS